MSRNLAIPTFKLYGEDYDWPTPDLLHWESIAQRSRQHDWVIKPHRHSNLLQLIYVESGFARAQLDGSNFAIESPTILVIPPLTIHGFEFSPDTHGHVLTLATPLVQSIESNLGSHPAGLQNVGVVVAAEGEKRRLDNLMAEIANEYRGHQAYRDTVLQNLCAHLFVWVERQQSKDDSTSSTPENRGKHYFFRFQQLVEQHYFEHRPLGFYAQQLKISAPHLNSICRDVANASALQVIHERLLLEAKRNLVYTVLTIREISDSLGFSEPAYFSRFFKRMQKISPQQFRRL